ncbi:putative disease resistance protein RGA3 [Vitis vinifera]|uniref:Putative disease resistance protein RGA3 n=1 Tax=Vitis vinifera TaxID=29760 RepID=A0A438FT99_VITVI|nr:putative disease resistance protein RGA3 [Vitis vinifera]
MLLKIYAVLEDAEEKQMTNRASAVKFNFRMGYKIETITARLQDISTQKSDLGTDKEAIPDMLLKDESTDNEVCIIQLVGGGLGKTTLAQLAYNDDKVKDHFDLRVWVWVCVSDDIEVLRIAKIILQSVAPHTIMMPMI